jgi:hypothetical protein
VCRDKPIDLVFIVDGSGSICDNDPSLRILPDDSVTCENWEQVQGFITGVARRLQVGPDGAQMALVTYANAGRVYFNLDE